MLWLYYLYYMTHTFLLHIRGWGWDDLHTYHFLVVSHMNKICLADTIVDLFSLLGHFPYKKYCASPLMNIGPGPNSHSFSNIIQNSRNECHFLFSIPFSHLSIVIAKHTMWSAWILCIVISHLPSSCVRALCCVIMLHNEWYSTI